MFFLKVNQHSVLNGLNHEDSAIKRWILLLRRSKIDEEIYVDVFVFCYCTSIEGTFHRQFGKCALFSMFRSWANILLSLSNKTFQVLIFENIPSNHCYIIKYLEPRKEFTRLDSQNPC